MLMENGGVTTPKGFLASGIRAGIKKSGNPDLALLYSETPAVAAGVFTTNVFKASPVKLSIANLKNETHQAIVVNSGNANCANGRQGDADALAMAGYIADGTGARQAGGPARLDRNHRTPASAEKYRDKRA